MQVTDLTICLALLLGVLVVAYRLASPRADGRSLRGILDRAGLKACSLAGHPRRLDVVFVYCPSPRAASHVARVLAVEPSVYGVEPLGEDARTVMVTLA